MRWLDGLWLVRLLFLRGVAAIYLIAFVSALNQFPALLGERGLLPVRDFLDAVRFRDAPSPGAASSSRRSHSSASSTELRGRSSSLSGW